MARIQKHHVAYKPSEWILEFNMLQHRAISRVQVTKATEEAYMFLTNFIHALTFEWNRMRMELDTGVDCRVIDLSGAKLDKKLKVSGKELRKIVEKIEYLVTKEFRDHDNPTRLVMDIRPLVEEVYKRKKKVK